MRALPVYVITIHVSMSPVWPEMLPYIVNCQPIYQVN